MIVSKNYTNYTSSIKKQSNRIFTCCYSTNIYTGVVVCDAEITALDPVSIKIGPLPAAAVKRPHQVTIVIFSAQITLHTKQLYL